MSRQYLKERFMDARDMDGNQIPEAAEEHHESEAATGRSVDPGQVADSAGRMTERWAGVLDRLGGE
jgi:hypothetical protein